VRRAIGTWAASRGRHFLCKKRRAPDGDAPQGVQCLGDCRRINQPAEALWHATV
jgi:hypothetical protein